MCNISCNLKDTVLIINPTSSPVYLDEKFKSAGLFTIACFTNSDIDYLIQPTLKGKLFDCVIFLSRDFNQDLSLIEKTVKEKKLKIVLAFSSSEYDLAYSDRMAHFFCPDCTNFPETSEWRCNKRFMNTRLRDNDTPATKQLLVSNIKEIKWSELEFPLVVKPAEGGMGSVGVSICYSPEELKEYFKTLNQKKWGYCFTPDNFLLEELLIGDEYIIDMVAWNSQYHLIGIYYAAKETHGAHKICRHREFLPYEHSIAKQLREYCSTVLKNLDVRYGMMHLECIITADGPRLIELNPRVSGVSGMLNYFAEALTGIDQASHFIKLMQYKGGLPDENKTIPTKHGIVFYLQNFGFKYDGINENLFTELASYRRHLVRIPCQLEKSYPTNLLDTVAFVILADDSRDQIEMDLKKLKNLEAAGAFFKQI